MPEEVRRPTPPSLEFRAPDCPVCFTETAADGDGFTCESCGISWDRSGERPQWDDPHEPGCPSVIEWYNTPELEATHEIIRNEREQCILVPPHPGNEHRSFDAWHHWADDDPRVVAHAEAG